MKCRKPRFSVRRSCIAPVCLAGSLVAAWLPAQARSPQGPTGKPPRESADTAESHPESWLDALSGGKVKLDVRGRFEHADAKGARRSDAVTLRTRLGYETANYRGFDLFVEMEDIRTPDRSSYNAAGIHGDPTRTAITETEATDLNQAYLRYDYKLHGVGGVVGRQRIVFDDARFIGNVGWRQNEQTFDAARLTTDFDGNADWRLDYVFVDEVNRIFGDLGTGPVTRDFGSESHLVHASYDGFEFDQVVGFAYLLDLERSNGDRILSSDTFGVRLIGDRPLGDVYKLGYAASYARQVDGRGNPQDYSADYVLALVSAGHTDLGKVTAGYELLGSDNGLWFRTPLATLHAFEGWSDALLGAALTGTVGLPAGSAGTKDLYFGYAPNSLPWGLAGQVVYHSFDADTGPQLGWELDAVLKKAIAEKFEVLTKIAHFEGSSGLADVDRFWVDVAMRF